MAGARLAELIRASPYKARRLEAAVWGQERFGEGEAGVKVEFEGAVRVDAPVREWGECPSVNGVERHRGGVDSSSRTSWIMRVLTYTRAALGAGGGTERRVLGPRAGWW